MSSETPQLRLDFYAGYIIRTLFDGQAVSQHAVDPHDVASALSNAAISTPILCGDEVFWSRRDGHEQIGIYVQPQRWHVQLQNQPGPITIPLPSLLFVGHYTQYWVFACKERPVSAASRLYAAPCPNVFPSGQICRGNVPFPVCSMATIRDAFQLFLVESEFNNHLANGRCRSFDGHCLHLWMHLAGKRRFPQSELVAAGSHTLREVRERCLLR